MDGHALPRALAELTPILGAALLRTRRAMRLLSAHVAELGHAQMPVTPTAAGLLAIHAPRVPLRAKLAPAVGLHVMPGLLARSY
jgi:hypothetical protein